jgi:hypothetical protein
MPEKNNIVGNGYTLARQWFDFAAENPDLITVNQTALYSMLIDLNNRRGWAEKFNFNTQDACDLIGVKNRKTVWEALNKLVEFGFVSMIYKANAPGRASVVSIVNNKVISNGCLNMSLINQSVKRTGEEAVDKQWTDALGSSKETVDGHSIKQINNKQKNRERFVPPAPGDVFIFFKEKKVWDEKKCAAEADKFCNHYTGIGWLAASGLKIVSWENIASGWITKDAAFGDKGKINGLAFSFPDRYDRSFAQTCDQPKLKAYFEYLEAEGWYKDGMDKNGAIWKKRDE